MAIEAMCSEGHRYLQYAEFLGPPPEWWNPCPTCRGEQKAENSPEITLETRSVMRVNLQPSDVLVVRSDNALPVAERVRMLEALHRSFPGHEVLILDRGITLSVVGAPK